MEAELCFARTGDFDQTLFQEPSAFVSCHFGVVGRPGLTNGALAGTVVPGRTYRGESNGTALTFGASAGICLACAAGIAPTGELSLEGTRGGGIDVAGIFRR